MRINTVPTDKMSHGQDVGEDLEKFIGEAQPWREWF